MDVWESKFINYSIVKSSCCQILLTLTFYLLFACNKVLLENNKRSELTTIVTFLPPKIYLHTIFIVNICTQRHQVSHSTRTLAII